jgi:hypothetical protein
MSWLSDFLSTLKPSSREEHFWAKIAGEEELENDTIPSSREEGFMYKIAQKIQGGSLPDASEASEGDVLTIDDGEPVWAAGGGGSGGGVLMVTDTNGTLDKTMGEIQDAYLAGKRVIISVDNNDKDVIGIIPVQAGKGDYFGRIRTYETVVINQRMVFFQSYYSTFGETEEAVRNAYPAIGE